MARLLAIAAVLLLLAIASAAGYLLLADLSHLQRPFLTLLSNFIDREVIVDGAFELDLGWQLSVSASGVRLANAEWSERGDMLTSASLSVDIEMLSLLPRRQLIINRIDAQGVSLILEHDTDAQPNWDFGSRGGPETGAPLLRQVTLRDLDLVFDAPSRETPLRSHAAHLTLAESPSGLLELTADGVAEDQDFTVAGTLGPLAALVSGQDVAGHLSGSIGDLTFEAQGEIGEVASLRSVAASLDVSGPDASVIAVLVGEEGVLEGSFSVHATLTDASPGIAFRLNADFTDVDIKAHGRLPDPLDLGTWQMNVDIEGEYLARLGRMVGRDTWPEVAYVLTGALARSGSRLDADQVRLEVGESTLLLSAHMPEFPDPTGATAKVRLDGPDLARISTPFGFPGVIAAPFSLAAELRAAPEGHDLISADLVVGDHQLHAKGNLQGYPDFAGTQLDVDLSGKEFADLTSTFGIPDIADGPYTLGGRVRRTTDGFELDSVQLETANLGLSATGHVVARTGLAGSRVDLKVDVPSLQAPPLPASKLNATGSLGVEDDIVRLDGFEGRFGDVNFQLNGHVNPDRPKLVLRETVLTVDDMRVRLDGELILEDGSPVTDIAVIANGSRLSRLGDRFGYTLPALPFTVSADIRQAEERVEVSGAKVSVGDSSFQATGYYDPESDAHVGIDVDAKFIDLKPFLDDSATEQKSQPPPDSRRAGARVIPDTPISLDWLPDLVWRLKLRAEELQAFAVPVRNVVADLDVGPDHLWLTPFQFDEPSGALSGELKLDRVDGEVRVEADLVARDVVLSFLAAPDQDPATMPNATIELKAQGRGTSGRELVRDLDGRLRFLTGEGRVARAASQALFGDFFTGVVNAVNPFAQRSRYTDLVCGVVLVDIADGKVQTRPGIAVQTDQLNVLAHGSVDLDTERINFNFETRPRRGVGISAGDLINPFTRVGGTLANPSLTIDRTGAAVSGGAAFATGGLSLLFQTAWNRIRRSDDPCGVLLRAEERMATD